MFDNWFQHAPFEREFKPTALQAEAARALV